MVSLRCSWSLSLLSHFVFQEGLLTFPLLHVFTGWFRSWILNSMHWWSLKVITSRTHQSPIFEARRGAAIVRSIIDLQQASLLPWSVQLRDTWPYRWHLKHRASSTCSRMRQFTHPTLSLPNPSKLRASASVKRTTAVCTPPKRL